MTGKIIKCDDCTLYGDGLICDMHKSNWDIEGCTKGIVGTKKYWICTGCGLRSVKINMPATKWANGHVCNSIEIGKEKYDEIEKYYNFMREKWNLFVDIYNNKDSSLDELREVADRLHCRSVVGMHYIRCPDIIKSFGFFKEQKDMAYGLMRLHLTEPDTWKNRQKIDDGKKFLIR